MRRVGVILAMVVVLAGIGALWVHKLLRLKPPSGLPPATRLLMQNVSEADQDVIKAIFSVRNGVSGRTATGTLVDQGFILTDAHAVAGARLSDLTVRSSAGAPVKLRGLEVDRELDVAFLAPAERLKGGLELGDDATAGPGEQAYTWGYPSGFETPQPLLCMGFVSGFMPAGTGESAGGRIVLSGPFSDGSAGGPLYRWKDYQLLGLVVTRPAASDPYAARLLKALGSAGSGASVSVPDESGRVETLSRDQALAKAIARVEGSQTGPIAEAVPFSLIKQRLEGMK